MIKLKQIELNYNPVFWKKYDWGKITMQPSTFSQFCFSYMKEGESILDVCNGNGRDTTYFKEKGLVVDSFDWGTVNLEDKKPKFSLDKIFDNVYCRFVLHSIPEHLEDYVLINSAKVLKTGGLLFIEVRSDEGNLSKAINHHYRRLINISDLRKKLTYLNFEIMFELESDNLSVYNGEDPILIRFVVRKLGEIVTRGTVRDEKKTYCPLHLDTSIYLLFTVKQIFDDNKIPFFLVFGTLLGAYRDGGFIKGDSDIDLALLDDQRDKVMQLIDDGYFAIYGLKFIREWHEKPHLKALQYKRDYIDFWFFRKAGDLYKSGNRYTIESYQIDKGLSTVKLYGEKFKTVHNIEKYFERHYPDSDWRIPVEDYHSKI